MIVYCYDNNKKYIGTDKADKNPKSNGYIIPANSTLIQPDLSLIDETHELYFINNKWVVKEILIGNDEQEVVIINGVEKLMYFYYDNNGNKFYTETKRPNNCYDYIDNKWVQNKDKLHCKFIDEVKIKRKALNNGSFYVTYNNINYFKSLSINSDDLSEYQNMVNKVVLGTWDNENDYFNCYLASEENIDKNKRNIQNLNLTIEQMKTLLKSISDYQQANRKRANEIIDLIKQTSYYETAENVYNNNIELGWSNNTLIVE